MTFTQQDLGSAIRTIQLHSNRDRFTFEQLLPCELATAVQTLTQEYAADPMTASLIFLGGLSGLLPLGSRVAHGHGYSVPLNLFLGVVARSGFSKTELMRRLVEWPAEGIRKRAREDFKRRRMEWFRTEVCAAKERKEEPGPEPLPLLPHLQNYSTEALSRYLEEYEAAGRGVLLFKDEL